MLIVNREILFIDLRKNLFTSDDVARFLWTIKDKTILEYLLLDRQYLGNSDLIETKEEINLSRKSREANLLSIISVEDLKKFDWEVAQVD